jgi:hypothetical protein
VALVKGSLVALLLTIGACCPGMIVDYAVYFDGGVPDGLTDASCAEYCATKFPGRDFVGCAVRPAYGGLSPEHIGCEGQAICR